MGKINIEIQKILKSFDETAEIISVIDEITFQANLPALARTCGNASTGDAGFEAARTGGSWLNIPCCC